VSVSVSFPLSPPPMSKVHACVISEAWSLSLSQLPQPTQTTRPTRSQHYLGMTSPPMQGEAGKRGIHHSPSDHHTHTTCHSPFLLLPSLLLTTDHPNPTLNHGQDALQEVRQGP
jgi:hypothetical protein